MLAAKPFAQKSLSFVMGTLSFAALLVVDSPSAVAAEVADPTFQVKLQLSDSAIDASGNPTPEFSNFAKVGRLTGTEESVYIDTTDKFYDAQVNASFTTSTLDFSNKKAVACADYECVIPDKATALRLVRH